MLSKTWLAAAAIVSLCAGPALADADGVVGKMNPQTGIFTPLAPSPDAATKVYAGTIQVTLNIQIKSALPAKQSYICSISASVFNTAGGNASATASIAQAAAGKTLKCVFTVPYSWALPSGGTLTTSTSWSVSAVEPTGAARTAGGSLAGFNPATTANPKLSASGAL